MSNGRTAILAKDGFVQMNVQRPMTVDDVIHEMRRTCGICWAERRKALGMTQREIAEMVGYGNRSVVARKETGALWVKRIDSLALEAIEFRAVAMLLLDGSAADWNDGLRRMRRLMDSVENTEQECSESVLRELSTD